MQAPFKPSPNEIQTLFDSLALRYDIFNRLTSMGMDKSWRRKVLHPLEPGSRVLDLGCGTGDLCLEVARKLRTSGQTVGLDFSAQMLGIAKRRYERMGMPANGHFQLLQNSAEDLPLDQQPFDLVISGFVLRNLYQNIDKILRGVYASLKDGGEIRFLDFTEPRSAWMRGVWRFYMSTFATFYGKLLFGDKFPKDYMAASAKNFAKPDEFVEKLRQSGFQRISVRYFWFGIIVMYRAVKTAPAARLV